MDPLTIAAIAGSVVLIVAVPIGAVVLSERRTRRLTEQDQQDYTAVPLLIKPDTLPSIDEPAPVETPWNELDADPDEPTPLLPHRQPTFRWETHTQTFGPELVALIRNLGHALESDTTDPEQRHDRMQALLDARYGRTS